MTGIRAAAKSIRALLGGAKFSIDYYQREYRWDGKQANEPIANHADQHVDEFYHPTDFAEYRNRIGGLLLLAKSFNASYGDKPDSVKREHYFGQNLLAQSLHENAYDHNPGFQRFCEHSGLPSAADPEFKKTDLDARQELYREIAERIWSPSNLMREVEADPAEVATA